MNSKFSFVFGSIDKQEFVEKYLNKKPLLIKGGSEKFDRVFNLEDFNNILNSNELNYPKVRVTDHNNTIHKYNLIDDRDRYLNNINNNLNKEKVLHAIARGGTLVFDKIQEHSLKLEKFIDELAGELNTRIGVNGYYTARNNMGVNPHFDRHDVLALQVHGSKRWYYRKYDHALSKSIRHQEVPAVDDKFTGWDSVLVEQGDAFYCPRGLWHFTRTEAQHSAHLAVGVYPLTLKEWLLRMEKNDQLASLLEKYVRQPFQPEFSAVNEDAIKELVDFLLSSAGQPFDLDLQPRPYLELE